MRAAVVGAVLALCLGTCAVAQGRPKLPLLPTDVSTKHNLQLRPFVISYTGDGSGFLGGFARNGSRPHFGRMRWPQWNRSQATGRGAVWIDDCLPDCAAGTFHPYRVTVYATHPEANVFRRLTLRYRYQGKRVVDRRKVVHVGRAWYYGLVGVP